MTKPGTNRYEDSLTARDSFKSIIGSSSRTLIEWMCAALVGALCLPRVLTADFLARAPVADRGLFIATGKLIAQGAVMYRDVYDNKTPGIYLLSAFGWWLSPNPRSVFIVERCAIILLVAALFAMLRYGFRFRLLPSLGGLAVGLIMFRNPEIFSGGHVTEEYGIVLQTAALAFVGLALHRIQDPEWACLWAVSAGIAAGLMILTRQSFMISLVALWMAIHFPNFRHNRLGLSRIVAWELIGFGLPLTMLLAYLWWFGALRHFLELVSDTIVFAAEPGKGPMTTRLGRGLLVLGRKTLQDNVLAETLLAIVIVATVGVAQWRQSVRRTLDLRLPALILLVWFIAELFAASMPAEYYNHQYIPFVPILASAAALLAELLVPRTVSFSLAPALRTATGVAMLSGLVAILDARYRADPTKYWFLFAPGAHLPEPILQTITDHARQLGWRTYVPLNTMATHILLDMPLQPATRFIVQYRYQFPGPDSARGQELLDDIARADVVVEDTARLRLDPALDSRIRSLLQTSFSPFLTSSTKLRFYSRNRPATPTAPVS